MNVVESKISALEKANEALSSKFIRCSYLNDLSISRLYESVSLLSQVEIKYPSN